MQFVGYDSTDGGLLLTSDGDVEYVELTPGERLAYTLGDRHCAGTVNENEHVACDAEDAPYCDRHRSTWVCARCTGTCLKDEMDCFEEHAVYLAAFGPATFKVGVTRRWRLETRLREQGADRAAHVRTVEDGRIARRIEAAIAAEIPDRVRVPTKLSSLHEPVDDGAWASLLADYDPIETFAFDYGFDLTERPMAETMATGTVRGTKGRLLILDRGGTTYAIDMRDLVGHDVTEGTTEREMQSSLGAFG